MGCVLYESYYLDEAEFYVLLAGTGKKIWYGWETENGGRPEDMNKVHIILAHLYQKGIIEWKAGKAVLLEPFYTIFNILKHADVCIISRKIQTDTGVRSQYFYQQKVVMIEQSLREKHTFRLTCMEWKDWLDLLQEETYFPEKISDINDHCEQNEPFSVFEKVDIGRGCILERMLVEDAGLCGFLNLKSQERYMRLNCERQIWESILEQWLKKED